MTSVGSVQEPWGWIVVLSAERDWILPRAISLIDFPTADHGVLGHAGWATRGPLGLPPRKEQCQLRAAGGRVRVNGASSSVPRWLQLTPKTVVTAAKGGAGYSFCPQDSVTQALDAREAVPAPQQKRHRMLV